MDYTIIAYGIPARYLNDNLVEMLFWDAVFYLLAVRGERNRENHHFVETTLKELTALTGLSTRSLRKQLDAAMDQPEPYQLQEDEGIIAYGRVLKFRQFDALMAQEKCILKPTVFMANGWGEVLSRSYLDAKKSSRFPLTLLNRLLMKPAGRATTRAELIRRARHPDPKKGKKPPDASVVAQALDHLLALGLIDTVADGAFVARREQLDLPATQIWEQLVQKVTGDGLPDSVQKAQAQDAPRAELALQLAEMGNFALEPHFPEIFYALSQFRMETDLPWIEYVVKRNSGKPAGKKRWQNCLSAIERKLLQESAVIQSVKEKLDLSQPGPYERELTLPPDPRQLRWAKLVVWYEDARFIFSGLPSNVVVEASLWLDTMMIWERHLTYRDALEHYDLTNILQKHPQAIFRFTVLTEEPSPHVSLSVMLEAQYIQ